MGVLDQLQRPVRPRVRRAEGVHQRIRACCQGGQLLLVLAWILCRLLVWQLAQKEFTKEFVPVARCEREER